MTNDDMPTPQLEAAFDLTLAFGEPLAIGRLATGGERQVLPVTGGTIAGTRLRGTVVSGSEAGLSRRDGVTTLELSYLVRAEDGTLIRMSGTGIRADGGFAGIRTTIVFEVDESSAHE